MRKLHPALVALLAFVLVQRAAAQEYGAGFARLLGLGGDRAQYSASAQFGDRGPFLWRQQADIAHTVHKSSSGTWTAQGRAGELALGSERITIPESGVVVPEKLWSMQAGTGYTRELGERRRWGAAAALGSSSDRPFLTWRDDQITASAYYQKSSGLHNSWIFLLNYSNNRAFLNNVPLPGFAYVVDDPAHNLNLLVGFPFLSARWRMNDDWTLSGGVFGTAGYSLEAARRLSAHLSAYARLERQPIQWLRSDRADDTDRLIFDSKQAALGARSQLGDGFSLDASAGRSFDRRFFEGRDAGRREASRAALADAWVLQASLSRRF